MLGFTHKISALFLKNQILQLYRVSRQKHSAIFSLALGKSASNGSSDLPSAFLFLVKSLPSVFPKKNLCRVPDKWHSANSSLLSVFFYRICFAVCHTRQSLCRVQYELCRVFLALGKTWKSGSASGGQNSEGRLFPLLKYPYSLHPNLITASLSILSRNTCTDQVSRYKQGTVRFLLKAIFI